MFFWNNGNHLQDHVCQKPGDPSWHVYCLPFNTMSTYLILPDLIALTVMDQKYKLCIFSFCNFLHFCVTSTHSFLSYDPKDMQSTDCG
jgi:hypothetical protein